jgi:hypothetical protein
MSHQQVAASAVAKKFNEIKGLREIASLFSLENAAKNGLWHKSGTVRNW